MQETRRRRFARAGAVPIGLLAAGALVFAGSQSAFTATTDNAGNTWSAGKVDLKNNGGKTTAGAADFAVNSTPAAFPATGGGTNLVMRPGATDSKCIVVENTSDWTTPVKFYFTNVDGTFTAPGTAKLSTELLVKVEFAAGSSPNCTGFTSSGTIFGATGSGAVMPTSGAGTTYASGFGAWTPVGGSASYATYKITWTLPSTATNAVQNSTATATFNWEQQLP